MAGANWTIVFRNGSSGTGTEIEEFGHVVCTCTDHFGSILENNCNVSLLYAKTGKKDHVQERPTGDQQQFKTGASAFNIAFPSLWPVGLIS